MIQRLGKIVQNGLVSVLILFCGADAMAAPLIGEVLLLREPDTRGFLTFFDVMLGLLIVFTYTRLKKYPKKIS